jgi:hypothetical protein
VTQPSQSPLATLSGLIMMIAIFTAKKLIFLFHRLLHYWHFAAVCGVFFLEGRSPWSRSPFSNSVISPAVVGFLILFNAREKIF